MDDDVRLEVRSDPRLLATVRNVIRSWVESCELGAEVADELVLAIDEACANAIRHSYEGRSDRSVGLTLRSDSEFLEVRLCDDGVPCSPESVERRELEAPTAEELKPGGLGVQLIHQVFDHVEFCPGEESGNCVVMRKKRKR